MKDRITVTPSITAASQPSEKEIRALPKEGFRSVVNLRQAGEEDQPLSPAEEEKLVRSLGLDYLSIPVSQNDGPTADQVDLFRREIERLPAPVFVHCRRGKRAGAFSLMHLAVKEGLGPMQAYQKAMELGFECDVPKLKEFFVQYISNHVTAG